MSITSAPLTDSSIMVRRNFKHIVRNPVTVFNAALTLRVPSDGGVTSLRALLNRLDEHSIDVAEFSVHTPDLDDVFLALTGHATTEAIAQ